MTDQKHTEETDKRDCDHGRLARKCEICQLYEEIAILLTQLDAVTKQRDELAEALDFFTKSYVQFINSGDAGNWNPEKEECVIKARAALARAKGEV